MHPDTKKLLLSLANEYGLSLEEVYREWIRRIIAEGILPDGRRVTFTGWMIAKYKAEESRGNSGEMTDNGHSLNTLKPIL